MPSTQLRAQPMDGDERNHRTRGAPLNAPLASAGERCRGAPKRPAKDLTKALRANDQTRSNRRKAWKSPLSIEERAFGGAFAGREGALGG